jgi:hypothetical protein
MLSNNMNSQRRRFNIIFNSAVGFILITFVLLICSWILLLFVGGQIVKDVDFSKGIKPVVEKVWCGESGCLDKK